MTPPTSTLAAFADWLASTPLSVTILSVSWLVPLVQTIHILALAALLSSVGMIGLRIVGRAGGHASVADTARRYVPWIWGALVIMLLTGLTLIIGEPGRSLTNAYLQWKMALLVLGVLLVCGFRTTVARHAPLWDPDRRPRPLAGTLAAFTFALFVAIAVLGRWIAYAG
jgi:hypothetical protein